VIGWFRDLPDRMRRTTVTVDSEAVVVRAGHPLLQQPVTMARLFAFPHIVVELTGSEAEPIEGSWTTAVFSAAYGSNGC
jgi:hypothetical protein